MTLTSGRALNGEKTKKAVNIGWAEANFFFVTDEGLGHKHVIAKTVKRNNVIFDWCLLSIIRLNRTVFVSFKYICFKVKIH